MTKPTEPGTATREQLDRIHARAPEARVDDDRHLSVLAMAERNRTRHYARTDAPPPLHRLADMSAQEASNLIVLLEDHAGGPPPTTCARCARLGFLPQDVCMHDRTPATTRQMAVEEYERRRGRRSW